jgi:predicted house-cleaning noncanonical NTP pyrophosphatase (MazG superfamily)
MISYNKIVRNKISQIIGADIKRYDTRIAA